MSHLRSTDALALESNINQKKRLSLRIKVYCIAEIIYCVLSFAWALYHVVMMKFMDAGVITFPLVIIASAFGLYSVHYYETKRDIKARYFGMVHCFAIIISHALLAANFIAGAILDRGIDSDQENLVQDTYFTLMAMYFVLTAALFGRWSCRFYRLFREHTAYEILLADTDNA
eukprot:695510_1